MFAPTFLERPDRCPFKGVRNKKPVPPHRPTPISASAPSSHKSPRIPHPKSLAGLRLLIAAPGSLVHKLSATLTISGRILKPKLPTSTSLLFSFLKFPKSPLVSAGTYSQPHSTCPGSPQKTLQCLPWVHCAFHQRPCRYISFSQQVCGPFRPAVGANPIDLAEPARTSRPWSPRHPHLWFEGSGCSTARNAPVLVVPLLPPFYVPGSAASPSMPPGRPSSAGTPPREQPRHPRSCQCDPRRPPREFSDRHLSPGVRSVWPRSHGAS